jgi:hypothetical protein
MATQLQGKYLIISGSEYNGEVEAWLPHSFIMWNDEYHVERGREQNTLRHFENVGRCFPTQTAADNFGFTVARAWIVDTA